MDRLAKLRTLLDANPRDGFVLYGIAQEEAKRGEHEAAIGLYDRLIEVEPGHCYAFFFKARSLAALGRVDEAKRIASEGLAVARRLGDEKAANELGGLQTELELA
ncbi:MAG: tetratricopeptide repeat protein [Phycisphaerales bacterium]